MSTATMSETSRKWWALAAVGSGTFMSTVDGSIVNIALNTIQKTFFYTQLKYKNYLI